jgi:hypothetical protein
MLYRHWLELRWRWIIVLLMATLIALALPGRLSRLLADFAITGQLSWPVQPYTELLRPLGAGTLHLWHELVGQTFGVMMFTAMIIFVFDLGAAAQYKDYGMLSLPVSRQRALWTRFAIDCLELAAAGGLMLGFAALFAGRPMPWQMLFISCAMAWLGTLPLLAAMKCVSVASPSWTIAGILCAVGLVPYLIAVVRVLHGARDVILDPSLTTYFVLWASLGLGVFCGLAAYAANQREY